MLNQSSSVVKIEFTSNLPHQFRLIGAALLFLVASIAYAVPDSNTIAKVRHLPLGTVVAIEGTVTTPSGVFESSFFDKGFAIQDRTAGIYVSIQNNLGVVPGQKVKVIGTLQDSYGLLILVPNDSSDVVPQGRGFRIKPRWFATGSIGEETEGRLVHVVGTVTQALVSDLPYGYKFSINDGSGELQIFVNVQTGINVNNLALGQRLSITGFSSQFENHYEIDPRSPSDIEAQMPSDHTKDLPH